MENINFKWNNCCLFWESYEANKLPCGQNADLFNVKAGEIWRMKRNSPQILHESKMVLNICPEKLIFRDMHNHHHHHHQTVK
jgi:hypothetical protein